MEYQRVSNTDLYISRITLSCRAFSGSDYLGGPCEDDFIGTVHSALDLGINSFDTSPRCGNGKAEEVLGKALGGRREEALIFSEVGEHVLDADSLVSSCVDSLRRLKTDRIDFLKIDRSRSTISLEELYRGLRVLLKRGMVREFGVSGYKSGDSLEYEGAAFVQTPCSLLSRGVEDCTLDACVESGLTAMACSPLQHGLLIGNYPAVKDIPLSKRRCLDLFEGELKLEKLVTMSEFDYSNIIRNLDLLSKKYSAKMIHLALGWVLNQSNVGSVIVGACMPHQIVENVSVLDVRFTQELIEEIGAVRLGVSGMCNHSPNLIEVISQ